MMTEIGIGHNNPPSDAEILAEKLSNDNAELLQKAKDIVESGNRIPETLDEVSAEKVAILKKTIQTVNKKLEDARTTAKEPFLAQGKVVDTFFKAYMGSLNQVALKAQKPLDAFVKEKHRLEQLRQTELEAQRQKEAESLMSVAVEVSKVDVGAGEVAFEDALAAELDSKKHEKASQAKVGLVAVRSDIGVTAALRTTIHSEITNIADLDLETLRFLIPVAALQTALNGYVRGGGRELKGARIWEEQTTVVK